MAIVIESATFLHLPKCGGTWVRQALAAAGLGPREEPPGEPHRIAATEGRFVFTFVRHPLSWYRSFWNYRLSTAASRDGPLDGHLREMARRAAEPIDACLVDDDGRPRSFAAFAAACVERHPGFLSDRFALFAGESDFVGRQESLCEDLVAALTRAGAAFDPEVIRRVPRVNEADPRFRAHYPPGLAARLLAAESAAVEAFYRGTVTTAAA